MRESGRERPFGLRRSCAAGPVRRSALRRRRESAARDGWRGCRRSRRRRRSRRASGSEPSPSSRVRMGGGRRLVKRSYVARSSVVCAVTSCRSGSVRDRRGAHECMSSHGLFRGGTSDPIEERSTRSDRRRIRRMLWMSVSTSAWALWGCPATARRTVSSRGRPLRSRRRPLQRDRFFRPLGLPFAPSCRAGSAAMRGIDRARAVDVAGRL